MMRGYYYNDWGWGHWLGMALGWAFFIALIVGVVVLLSRRPWEQHHSHPALPMPQERPGPSAAERILDERFARGEIDEEEYTKRRRLLSEPRSPGV